MPVTDMELEAVLGMPCRERKPWPYSSSFPIDELLLETDLGARRVLFKELSSPLAAVRPEFVGGAAREIGVYEQVLVPLRIDAPPVVATVVSAGRAWLFLDLLEATPLAQIGGAEIWEYAARWLARLHGTAPTRSRSLLHYDEEELQRRFALARGIPRADEIGRRVARRLAQLPRSLVHGEFYPSNVLVNDADQSRIQVVDWEMAGVGPGVLDLAALVSGAWSEPERTRIVAAYHDACPAALRPSDDDLLYARLLLAAQWSGWPRTQPPPPGHRHDWRAEAVALISRLDP